MAANVEGITSLPVVAIDRILSYLSYGELLTLGKTCSFFRHSLHDSNYHWRNVRKIKFNFKIHTQENIQKCIKRCRGLSRVSFQESNDFSKILTLLESISRLTHLELNDFQYFVEILRQLPLMAPKLEVLKFRQGMLCKGPDKNKIVGFTNLRVFYCDLVRFGLDELLMLAGESRNLSHLKLDMEELSLAHAKVIIGGLNNWSNLVVLHLKIWRISMNTIRTLCHLPKLEVLVLEGMKHVFVFGVLSLSEKFKELKKLTFRNCMIERKRRTRITELKCRFSIEFCDESWFSQQYNS